mmetsp:Transcript_66283/g.117721  ORF Transcript_66283/g.117721 Transcript_66283/m.117721 type:complete len:181 (-) Transcript_66283:141-683(-)
MAAKLVLRSGGTHWLPCRLTLELCRTSTKDLCALTDVVGRGTLGDVVRTGEMRRDVGDNTPCCGAGLRRPRELGLGESDLSGDIDVAARGDIVLRELDRRRVEGVAETRRLGDTPASAIFWRGEALVRPRDAAPKDVVAREDVACVLFDGEALVEFGKEREEDVKAYMDRGCVCVPPRLR